MHLRGVLSANDLENDELHKTNSAARPSTASDPNQRTAAPSETASHTRANTAEDEKQDADPEKGADAAAEKLGKLPPPLKAKGGRKKKGKPQYDSSLLKAIHNTFFFRWWAAGLLKLCGGDPPPPRLGSHTEYNHKRRYPEHDDAACK